MARPLETRICCYCRKPIIPPNNAFGLTYCCDKCFRIKYNREVQNWKESGHKYPWTIDGRLIKK